jgi:hypothetical protein
LFASSGFAARDFSTSKPLPWRSAMSTMTTSGATSAMSASDLCRVRVTDDRCAVPLQQLLQQRRHDFRILDQKYAKFHPARSPIHACLHPIVPGRTESVVCARTAVLSVARLSLCRRRGGKLRWLCLLAGTSGTRRRIGAPWSAA